MTEQSVHGPQIARVKRLPTSGVDAWVTFSSDRKLRCAKDTRCYSGFLRIDSAFAMRRWTRNFSFYPSSKFGVVPEAHCSLTHVVCVSSHRIATKLHCVCFHSDGTVTIQPVACQHTFARSYEIARSFRKWNKILFSKFYVDVLWNRHHVSQSQKSSGSLSSAERGSCRASIAYQLRKGVLLGFHLGRRNRAAHLQLEQLETGTLQDLFFKPVFQGHQSVQVNSFCGHAQPIAPSWTFQRRRKSFGFTRQKSK